MAWLATLPAGADRSDGVTEAFRDWMIHDRKAAFAWIEETEIQPWNEPALALYARAIARRAPEGGDRAGAAHQRPGAPREHHDR